VTLILNIVLKITLTATPALRALFHIAESLPATQFGNHGR
jgi:hypothetical protein